MGLSVDLSEVGQALSAVSSVAVIVGVAFIVFQLRQNNRLIEASKRQVEANLLQVKSNTALSLVERFTDDSFTKRRKTVRDIVRKYGANDWREFVETGDDFEVRTFCSFYEFAAVLARRGARRASDSHGGAGIPSNLRLGGRKTCGRILQEELEQELCLHEFRMAGRTNPEVLGNERAGADGPDGLMTFEKDSSLLF